MPNNRDYKQFCKGSYYHIFNRGNDKRDIFLDEEDYSFFILRLQQNLFPDNNRFTRVISLPEGAFSLISYCLMPNHFHFLLRQNTEIPTSKLLQKICTSYSKYFNKKYDKVGHIFQDQFKQVNIEDDSYLMWLSAYIHQNPKIAGLVNDLKDYRWSSYRDFLDLGGDIPCDKLIICGRLNKLGEYIDFVESSYQTIKDNKHTKDLFID